MGRSETGRKDGERWEVKHAYIYKRERERDAKRRERQEAGKERKVCAGASARVGQRERTGGGENRMCERKKEKANGGVGGTDARSESRRVFPRL